MNKKYLAFGFMGLFVMAFAAAALVPYLSNTEEVSMSVSSPILVSEIIGDDLTGIYGGETASINFDVTNLADVDTYAKMEIIISNDGISVDDFNSINTEITEGSWTSGVIDALVIGGLIESIEDLGDSIVITTTEQPWQAGKNPWHVTSDISFVANAAGDYDLAVTMIPA